MSNEIKVVVRYAGGNILRGTTDNFWPTHGSFHLKELGTPADAPTREVVIDKLKAVFIVKSFEGNAKHSESNTLVNAGPPSGSPIRVVFTDGETLVGSTMSYDARAAGFFMFPADRKSNNERVFVVNAAVDRIEHLSAVAS